MIKITILIKENPDNHLSVSVQPEFQHASGLERGAAKIMKDHIDSAMKVYQNEAEKFLLDLEGKEAEEWKRKIFDE